ncbi:protein of unknown function [Modestobacter italicus]|uniref:Uncharacterized protein n=1 Tax=Modestobacter italicus (strain DSM 44449 / CECT 9708 / BC 501) TaxID=2732864 RepID=I4F4W9_MODI5|nr:protein of unknown function [Modestobacter marinus]
MTHLAKAAWMSPFCAPIGRLAVIAAARSPLRGNHGHVFRPWPSGLSACVRASCDD